MLKKVTKVTAYILFFVVLIVVGYLAYVFMASPRIKDNITIKVNGSTDRNFVEPEKTYRIASANLGFGAYSADYSFFMDGGTESWARSKKDVINNVNGEMHSMLMVDPDIILCQEVDIDSTRSYHVDERELVLDAVSKAKVGHECHTFALNYHSPFLFYPLNQPHGKSKAGLFTVSSFNIESASRRSLPVEKGPTRLLDLDRCYTKNYINTKNGKLLVVYNVHLSAYTKNIETAKDQIKMLNDDMLDEIDAGNYVIAGGDMNKDVLGQSSKYFGKTSTELWALSFPTNLLSGEFELVGPVDEANPVPSCRNADAPYSDKTFVITVDGFIISSNIEVKKTGVVDTQFKYSDHNPVYMDFVLH